MSSFFKPALLCIVHVILAQATKVDCLPPAREHSQSQLASYNLNIKLQPSFTVSFSLVQGRLRVV
jgi:hypothetical protein